MTFDVKNKMDDLTERDDIQYLIAIDGKDTLEKVIKELKNVNCELDD